MATGTVNPALLLSGPGILYVAPLGTAVPAMTATAGKFAATAWGGAWVPVGATDEGSEFSDEIDTDAMQVAESYYDIKVVTTGRTATWSAALVEINVTNLKTALNGGTSTVESAVAGAEVTKMAPPTVGNEVRKMVGWQSEDDTVRFVGYQALQVGKLGLAFRKGADKATLSIEWRFEKPTGDVYNMWLAGAARVA